MPRCCEQTRVNFSNVDSTTINYTSAMRDQYGTQPKVYVYYYDQITGEFYMSTFFTVIKFNGSQIVVDHGGPNSGFVIVT